MIQQLAFVTSACLLAFVSSRSLYSAYSSMRKTRARAKTIGIQLGFEKGVKSFHVIECSGIAASILKNLIKNSAAFSHQKLRKQRLLQHVKKLGAKKYLTLSQKAGLKTRISLVCFVEARVKFALIASLCGLVLGYAISMPLMIILFVVGLLIGWACVPWAYQQEIKMRKGNLEKQLSEMLEVVSLGLRSGLSFDRSLEMYHEHFHTSFSAAIASCQKQWMTGLSSRENALRELTTTYDSIFFERVVSNIIRSLRFGASLVDSLEKSAAESRSIHKAKVEERVAKAPVKMLIPTGALILPAMLLLVLGPVLLDLMQGF